MIDVALHGSVGAFSLDLAFTAPAAGITAVFGPSGSGKTTLLRAMAGLTRLTGHVRVGDVAWQSGRTCLPVHKRRVGVIFQENALLSHLSVQGNLDFARRRSPARTELAAICDRLHIRDLLPRSIAKLSGGERQRVAIARALIQAPALLLMDEPLSSLDPAARDEILPLIKDVGRTCPIIYVSHDAYEIATLADRTLCLHMGRITAAADAAVTALDGLTDAQIRRLAETALKAGLQP